MDSEPGETALPNRKKARNKSTRESKWLSSSYVV